MKRKKIIILSLISLFAISLGIFVVKKYFNNNNYSGVLYDGLPVSYSHCSYAYDMSNPEKAIGATDYVFVAKIEDIERTEYRNPIEIDINEDGSITKKVTEPYTVYTATVITNIKGTLPVSEKIHIYQNGGITEDKKRYVFLEGTELLQLSEYYIILAFVPTENGNLEINNPYTYVHLTNIKNNNLSDTSETNIKINDVVLKYQKALENEIIPSDKLNTYKSKYDIAYQDK